jgi:hypothetical protein
MSSCGWARLWRTKYTYRERSRRTLPDRPRLDLVSASWGRLQREKLTLEVALFAVGVAGEGGLRLLLLERIEDLAVGDVAHLEVLIDDQTLAITDATLALRHHGIAGVVCLARVAVYTLPALFTLAIVALARKSVVAVGQRTTQRL